MQVRDAIENLRLSLEATSSEEELYRNVDDELKALRRIYPSQSMRFAQADIAFLQGVATVLEHLRRFIELREELLEVESLREYSELMIRLTQIRDGLGNIPVARRVAKEIRQLSEKLPIIRMQEEANRQFRFSSRKADLEQNPRQCRRHHAMVIREGQDGYFWGCSHYPFCRETSQLSSEQAKLLAT